MYDVMMEPDGCIWMGRRRGILYTFVSLRNLISTYNYYESGHGDFAVIVSTCSCIVGAGWRRVQFLRTAFSIPMLTRYRSSALDSVLPGQEKTISCSAGLSRVELQPKVSELGFLGRWRLVFVTLLYLEHVRSRPSAR